MKLVRSDGINLVTPTVEQVTGNAPKNFEKLVS